MRECTAEVTVARWLLIAAAVALVSPHLSPAPAAVAAQIGLPGCPTICGDVVVPYPFGFSRGCYLPGFDLTCDTSSSQPRLLLGNGTLQLMDISLDNSTVRALGPNIHLQTSGKLAYGYSGNGTWGGPGWGLGDGSPYSLSEWRNEFILWGCFFFGELWLAGSDRVVTTCGSVCDPHEPLPLLPDPDKINGNKCSGTGCCQEPVSIGRASYDVQLNSIRNWSPDNEVTARYIMFIAEEGWFDLNRISTKLSSNVESIPTPVVLSWEVHSNTLQGPNATRDGNATCPADLGTTMCHSSYSSCTRMNREDRDYHYTCKCWDGYQGNPYLPQGCQDVDECAHPDKCYGTCTNIPGTYLCECPHGTDGDPYVEHGCKKSYIGLKIAALILQGGALLFSLYLGIKFLLQKIKKQRKKRQQKFLNQNRGQLLHQLVCQRTDIAETMIITLKELEKATNKFDQAHELSHLGHVTLYTGILSSLHTVAIKKTNTMEQREIKNLINEVAILSQINHKNIVKLLGCCLETEVPLLVYESITNGIIYDHLHAPTSLSWRDRLRIAVETARALAYLHSFVSMTIIHEDLKSPKLLLDENLNVKLSDFGASICAPVDQTGPNIYNCVHVIESGYLEPTYNSIGHLCEKCDVYSFGIILIELLTRKKPGSYRSTHGYDLVNHFIALLSEHNLDCILDPQVTREGDGEVVDVSLLAAMYVKFIGEKRPPMRQVEMILESIHSAKEYGSSDMTDDGYEEDCNWGIDSSAG